MGKSKLQVLISGRFADRWLLKLRELFDVSFYQWENADAMPSPEKLVELLSGMHILITETDEISGTMMDQTPELAVIVDCRGNPTNIDVSAATERGILVMNTPGRNAYAVAELNVALMVMVARNVLPAITAMRNNEWVEKGLYHNYFTHHGTELYDKTAGLLGFGAIGRLVAERLDAFGMRVITYDPFVNPSIPEKIGVRLTSLDKLLETADFVSLHAPLNESTKGMLGKREFDLMKSTAYLINTARAGLVDEAALLDALKTNRIAGAALDVFHQEPLSGDAEILNLPNVFAVPHLGGATFCVVDHQSRIALENLSGLLSGNPKNIVNPQTSTAANYKLRALDSYRTQ